MTDAALTRLEDAGVVAVLRGLEPDVVGPVAAALVDGGIGAVEVTADSPGFPAVLGDVAAAVDEDALLGAGTVRDPETVDAAVDAGAAFVVSPVLEEAVVAACNRRDVLVAPGVLTPTEAARALGAGADLLKVFPAATLGPDHLAAMRAPLGNPPMLPTGGVDSGNAGAFIDAGAVAVGVGSALLDEEAIDAGRFERVTERARELTAAVDAARE